MPFTAAHPAAVLPLRRFCPRPLDWSALLIGTLTPDLECFLALRPHVDRGLTFAGSLYFCLPAGLALFVLFHALVKRPATLLLPRAWRERAWPLARARKRATPHDLASIAVSILVGAWLHQTWDVFTHPGRWEALTTLRVPEVSRLVPPGGFLVLQHGSTALGVACLAVALLGWRRRSRPAAAPQIAPWLRHALASVVILAPAAFGVRHAARYVPAVADPVSLGQFAGYAAIGAAALGALLLLAVGLAVTPFLGRLAPEAPPNSADCNRARVDPG